VILYVLGLAILEYGPWIFLAVMLWRSRRNRIAVGAILIGMLLLAVPRIMDSIRPGDGLIVRLASWALLWFLLVGWLGFTRKWLAALLVNAALLALAVNFIMQADRITARLPQAPAHAPIIPIPLLFLILTVSVTAVGAMLGYIFQRRAQP
jgi:hypothetical protein